MKNLAILFLSFLFMTTTLQAQNGKFQMAMGKALGEMASNKGVEGLKTSANTFSRIASVETTEWLPQYYAALCHLYAGYSIMESNMAEAQNLAKTALTEIQAAQKIAPSESELVALEAFAYQLQLLEDPMTKGAEMSGKIFATLGKAESLNPANPRTYYLRGNFTLNMPEFFGGGAAKASPDVQKAVAAYAAFTPASPFHPNWGAEEATELAEKVK
ncbi:hypothetical protein [Haliscomenobacter hydrossis]|uniref:Tetratricopeptide repeat protein n=1 Tax=Haliscomenobacter hydrossis (strain ATCC 27775 / DSM 1100 / LMG 10767 / O) TaxID=760192 RepID=F4KY88_HALH1|nr:hypothetical protein [Haliscomenobacter hydrossis]AEE48351.1 hypothetical protein Halhy_0440 [Haliscomenobacter hydrossis DSM 1100]